MSNEERALARDKVATGCARLPAELRVRVCVCVAAKATLFAVVVVVAVDVSSHRE